MAAEKIEFDTFELDHAQTLLDTIFGVIIALALTKLPTVVAEMISNPSNETITTLVLLLSSLLFCAFYWLESRHFVVEQRFFDKAIKEFNKVDKENNSVSFQQSIFLIGTLSMMGLAAAILQYSNYNYFITYFILNIIFWFVDLGGTISLKKSYYPFEKMLHESTNVTFQHHWFSGHIKSNFFIYYAIGNICYFLILLSLNITFNLPLIKSSTAIIILLFILTRHLYWRSSYYSEWLKKRLKMA